MVNSVWLDLRGRAAIKVLQEAKTVLEEANKQQNTRISHLETDWELMLDKINAAIARLNQRTRAASKLEEDEPTPDNTQPAPPASVGTHGALARMRARRGF